MTMGGSVIGNDLDLLGIVAEVSFSEARNRYEPAVHVISIYDGRGTSAVFIPEELSRMIDPESLKHKVVHYSRWGGENHKLEVLSSKEYPEVFTAGPAYGGLFSTFMRRAARRATTKGHS